MWHGGEILKIDARTAVAAVQVLFTIMGVALTKAHMLVCVQVMGGQIKDILIEIPMSRAETAQARLLL